jgi:hypothetical protein
MAITILFENERSRPISQLSFHIEESGQFAATTIPPDSWTGVVGDPSFVEFVCVLEMMISSFAMDAM